MKPDWDNAPEWAQYVCMNYDGNWYWFEFKPTYNSKTGSWQRGFYEGCGRNEKVKFHFNPEDSLMTRADDYHKKSS